MNHSRHIAAFLALALPISATTWVDNGATISNAGNVGIGVSGPTSKLQVEANGNLATPGPYPTVTPFMFLSWATDGPGTETRLPLFRMVAGRIATTDANAAKAIVFQVSADDKSLLDVRGNGFVGIGTTDPASALDVRLVVGKEEIASFHQGTQKYFTFQRSDAGTTTGGAYLGMYGGDNSLAIKLDTRAAGYSYFNAGNLGIGTGTGNPNAKLRVINKKDDTHYSDVLIGKVNSGLGDSHFEINNQKGKLFAVAARDNLSIDMGVNYTINSDNGTQGYVVNGSKRAPIIRMDGEWGDISIMGEIGPAGGNYRFPNHKLGVFVRSDGNVGIGHSSPSTALDVQGDATIRGNLKTTGGIDVASVKTRVWSIAPDYVFEKDYKLASLDHVERYVAMKKHLPEIPSAKEIKANGIDLAEMNMKLLRKVEELTLYAIDQKNEIKAMKSRLSELEKK